MDAEEVEMRSVFTNPWFVHSMVEEEFTSAQGASSELRDSGSNDSTKEFELYIPFAASESGTSRTESCVSQQKATISATKPTEWILAVPEFVMPAYHLRTLEGILVYLDYEVEAADGPPFTGLEKVILDWLESVEAEASAGRLTSPWQSSNYTRENLTPDAFSPEAVMNKRLSAAVEAEAGTLTRIRSIIQHRLSQCISCFAVAGRLGGQTQDLLLEQLLHDGAIRGFVAAQSSCVCVIVLASHCVGLGKQLSMLKMISKFWVDRTMRSGNIDEIEVV